MPDWVAGCAAVLLAFAGARWLSARLGHPPWASPVLVTALAMIAGLWLTELPLARFEAATAPLRWLLGPALVALALVIDANRSRLRAKAQTTLGAAFDIRGFHQAVLGAGALPLDVLEHRIDAWIARQAR